MKFEILSIKYWRYALATFSDAFVVGCGATLYMELNNRCTLEFSDNLLLFGCIVAVLLSCIKFLHKLILRNKITYKIFKFFGDFIVGIAVYIFALAFTSKNIDCKIVGNIIVAALLFSVASIISYAYSKKLQESEENSN